MSPKPSNEEVTFATEAVVKIGQEEIAALKRSSGTNARKRMRFCAHRDTDDQLHEMLIALACGTYIRPHKHLSKSESFHIIEGEVDVVLFDEAGTATDVIRMGDYQSGRTFYYRLSEPCYHTLLIRSETLVLHETTNGPFKPSDTTFAPWAPDESDPVSVADFMNHLETTCL
jgi:cupin fold WbuC family metalloprotein